VSNCAPASGDTRLAWQSYEKACFGHYIVGFACTFKRMSASRQGMAVLHAGVGQKVRDEGGPSYHAARIIRRELDGHLRLELVCDLQP